MKELIKTAKGAQDKISGGEKLDITYNSTIIDDIEITDSFGGLRNFYGYMKILEEQIN